MKQTQDRTLKAMFSAPVTPQQLPSLFSNYAFQYQLDPMGFYALLQFESENRAQEALRQFNGKTIQNVTITLRSRQQIQSDRMDTTEDFISETSCRNSVLARNGWIFLTDNSRIERYLVEFAPSKIFSEDGHHWISAQNTMYPEPNTSFDMQALQAEWNNLKKHKPTTKDMERLARTYNILCGKWMIFVPTNRVDAIWSLIARGVVDGKLRRTAKVGTSRKGRVQSHVICMYTTNWLDTEEREEVAKQIQKLLSHTEVKKMSYKPDLYTYLGIYGGAMEIVDSKQWK
jgi:hypothetical protein